MTWTFGRIGGPTPSVFTDNLERADGTLDDNGWTPFGLNASVADPTRYLQIVSGRATLGVVGAGYAARRVRNLRKMTMNFRFSSGTADVDTALGLVCSKYPTSTGIGNMGSHSIHGACATTGRTISYFNGFPLSSSPAADTDTFTLTSGTDYSWSMELTDPWSILVTDPDGGTETLGGEGTAAGNAIRALWGDYVYIECIVENLAHKLPSINSVTLEGDSTIVLESHYPAKWNGDEVSITADLSTLTVDDAIALRDQFNGYDLNGDEDVVTITSTADSTLDGSYRVQSTAVDDAIGTYLPGGLGSIVTVECLKVPGSKAPLMEARTVGAVRENDDSITTAPDEWAWYSPGVGALGYSRVNAGATDTRDSAEGDVIFDGSSVGAEYYDRASTWYAPPGSVYLAAPRVQVSPDEGQSWTAIIGQQCANEPVYWRLSNALVDIIGLDPVTSPNNENFTVSFFDGTSWSTPRAIRVRLGLLPVDVPAALTIVKNARDEVGIKVKYDLHEMYLWLRRGSRYVEGTLSEGDRIETPEAQTALTGGSRSTGSVGGNKLVVMCPHDHSVTGDDVVATVSHAPFAFGVGVAIAGATTNTIEGAQGVAYQYYANVRPSERVVVG